MATSRHDDSFFGPSAPSGSAAASQNQRDTRETESQRLLMLHARTRDQRPDPSSEPDYSAADATFFGVPSQQTQLHPPPHAQHPAQPHVQHTPQHTPQHQQTSPQQPYETYADESYEEYADDIELDSYDTESSNVFDPDEDPEGWAERIDELAGVIEMSEAEARAMRWGPAMGQEKGDLPVEEFQRVLDHHLDNTEWRFDETTGIGPGGGGTLVATIRAGLPFPADTHPISVSRG